MPLLDSFTVDHTRMEAPAVRVAKTMNTPHGDAITVFDLRFCIPNKEVMPEKGIHTLEHLFAGFMRNHLNGNGVEIIDISPMGCRTGFYMSLIGTPEEVLPKSLVYFRVYFAGSLGFVIYNFGMGILQSLGDSKSPVIYLIISACLNVILDLVLIGGLGFGVGAAAFATIVSQILSAVLCIRKLRREPEAFRLSFRELRMNGNMLRLIVVNGIPAGIQNSIIAVANVFVQSNINQFGALAMAGCGSYSKIEGFGFIPVTCFSQALTTFIGQNLGAKEYDRAKKGALFGTICGIGIAEVIGIAVFFFSPYLIAAFGGDQRAIEYGIAEAHTIALFYCLLAFSHCMAAIQRGAGRSIVPMFVMMIVWCGVRVTYISIVIRIIPVINVIYWAYPLTWFISSVIFLILFLKTDWIHGLEKQ